MVTADILGTKIQSVTGVIPSQCLIQTSQSYGFKKSKVVRM